MRDTSRSSARLGPLAIIVSLALLLRGIALTPYSMHHPDELFQYLEQSYRLLTGHGVIPWEYRYGIRSWFVPVLGVPLMALGEWIAPGTALYLKMPVLLSVAASVSIILSAWFIGRRTSMTHAAIAAAVPAIWFEQIFFASHLLTSVLATGCLLPALALLTSDNTTPRRLVIAGFLVGIGIVLRFQYIPAAGVLVLLTCRLDFRGKWVPVAMGGMAALLISCIVDIAMGQTPFGWIIENVRQNLVMDRAAGYGVSGPMEYFALMGLYWRWAALPILLLIIPAAGRHRTLLWVAVANIAFHMLIGHKEYRFVFLSVTIFLLLAALGSADLVERLRRLPRARTALRLAPGLVLLGWAGTSASLAMSEPMKSRWSAFSPALELEQEASHLPGLCGLAVHELPFWRTGGMSYLRHPTPLYFTSWTDSIRMDRHSFVAATPAFNALIMPAASTMPVPDGFRQVTCAGTGSIDDVSPGLCLYVRSGGCAPAAAKDWEVNRLLIRTDQ